MKFSIWLFAYALSALIHVPAFGSDEALPLFIAPPESGIVLILHKFPILSKRECLESFQDELLPLKSTLIAGIEELASLTKEPVQSECLPELLENQIRDFAKADQEKLWGESYKWRRFLAYKSGYQKTKDRKPAPEEFCQHYEALQLRDAEYARQRGPYTPFFSAAEWELAQSLRITETERGAITSYTGNRFGTLNVALRSQQPLDESDKIFHEVLRAALARLPNFEGKLRRDIAGLPPDVDKQHEEGKTVCYSGYTSTSKAKNWTYKKGQGPHSFHFTILGKSSGKAVEMFSNSHYEEEVLIPPGACFKITARSPRGKNGTEIEMTEVLKAQ